MIDWNGVERRRFVRANFPCKITIDASNENSIEYTTENIGVGGVRVLLGEELNIFSFVDMQLFLDQMPISCRGRVVWIISKPDSNNPDKKIYDTGIEFYEIKPEDKKRVYNIINTIVEKDGKESDGGK